MYPSKQTVHKPIRLNNAKALDLETIQYGLTNATKYVEEANKEKVR